MKAKGICKLQQHAHVYVMVTQHACGTVTQHAYGTVTWQSWGRMKGICPGGLVLATPQGRAAGSAPRLHGQSTSFEHNAVKSNQQEKQQSQCASLD